MADGVRQSDDFALYLEHYRIRLGCALIAPRPTTANTTPLSRPDSTSTARDSHPVGTTLFQITRSLEIGVAIVRLDECHKP